MQHGAAAEGRPTFLAAIFALGAGLVLRLAFHIAPKGKAVEQLSALPSERLSAGDLTFSVARVLQAVDCPAEPALRQCGARFRPNEPATECFSRLFVLAARS